jgi:ceramide glucosyltransferase
MTLYQLPYWVLLGISAFGVLSSALTIAALLPRFRAAAASPTSVPASGALPSLSLIVPIKGADPHTAAHLHALVSSDLPGEVEFLFALESDQDPAYSICARVRDQHPTRAIRVILTGPAGARMGKQHNLAVAAREARYAVIGSMDADVAVDPDTLRLALDALRDPTTGIAYFLPCYQGPGPVGGTVVALYTNYSFSPNMATLALRGGQHFIIGSLWVLRKETLARIGGFEPFGATVSDDAAIGKAIASAGLKNVLIPRRVIIPFEPLGLAGGARHLLKWLAMLRAEGLGAYLTIWLLWHPILWSAVTLLGTLLAALVLRRPPGSFAGYAAALLALAIVVRVSGAFQLNRWVYHTPSLWLPLLLVPYELLVVPLLFGAGLFRRTIVWRGRRYRLGHHGVIQAAAEV